MATQVANDVDEYFSETLLRQIELGNNDKVESILRNTNNPHRLRNSSGATLLHIAAKYGNAWLARYLLDLGVDVDAQNLLKETPLMYAVNKQRLECVKVLLDAKADVLISNLHGECPLKMAFDRETLINEEYNRSVSASPSRLTNSVSITTALLSRVTSESLKNSKLVKNKRFHNDCPLYMFMSLQNPEVTRVLLKKGSSVNAKDRNNGETSLHRAVERMDIESVKLLLEYGADVNVKNYMGETPLACLWNLKDQNKTLRMFEILASAGASLVDEKKEKIFVKLLLSGGNKEIIRSILARQIDLYFTDDEYSVLHHLAENDNPGVLAELHGFDFDVNIRTSDMCWTMLHIVVLNGKADSIRFLLDRGADVNATCNRYGYTDCTALSELVICHRRREDRLDAYVECVEILLERGADPQIVTESNRRRYQWNEPIPDSLIKIMRPIVACLPLVELSGKWITYTMRTVVLSVPQFKEIFNAKKVELEDMRQIELGKSVTLFDLLIASDEKISLYARNRSINKTLFGELKKDNLESCYQRKLEERFSKWTRLIELRTKAATVIDNCFVELCNVSIYNVAEKIIGYLDDDEVHELLKNDCLADDK